MDPANEMRPMDIRRVPERSEGEKEIAEPTLGRAPILLVALGYTHFIQPIGQC